MQIIIKTKCLSMTKMNIPSKFTKSNLPSWKTKKKIKSSACQAQINCIRETHRPALVHLEGQGSRMFRRVDISTLKSF